MTAKVRIKAGPIEFEYEGETELSIADIKDLFSHIEGLSTVPSLAAPSAETVEPEEPKHAAPATSNGGVKKLHVNSIATKLGAKSCSQIALAAAAYLQIMEEKASFDRNELLRTMQAANLHYKKSMSSNLSKGIAILVGSELNQIGHDKYSLKSETYSRLAEKLAA